MYINIIIKICTYLHIHTFFKKQKMYVIVLSVHRQFRIDQKRFNHIDHHHIGQDDADEGNAGYKYYDDSGLEYR